MNKSERRVAGNAAHERTLKRMRRRGPVFASALLYSTSLFPVAAVANPLDGTVTAGSATISSPDASTVAVTQHTDKVVIDWRSFSVSADELTQFYQPGSDSIALNRVTGGSRSDIDGALKGNGQVWLINPAGIAFGATAQVDVSGLVATTADISNADFMAGNYNFGIAGNPGATVSNAGNISIGDAGLAALVAPWVENDGVISARLGTVHLATGDTFTLDFAGDGLIQLDVDGVAGGLVQSGRISADGGRVLLTAADASSALDNVINMSGTIEARTVAQAGDEIILGGGFAGTMIARAESDSEASSGGGVSSVPATGSAEQAGGAITIDGGNGAVAVSGTLDVSGSGAGETGGSITVTGETVTLAATSSLDASGDAGGGLIRVGGDFQGKGDMPTAETTTVAAGATLKADAITNGDGGTVIVWADGTTDFKGHISARGGADGGDGGFAEVSGKTTLEYNGLADLSAFNGKTGTLLLDPTNFTIDGSNVGSITTSLDTANVVIATDSAGSEDGDIFVNEEIDYDSANSLTLLAHRNIVANESIQNAGAGDLTLVAGWDGSTQDPGAAGINSPASFDLASFIATPGSFGNNDGAVIIGDEQFRGTAIGSSAGTTTVLADDLFLNGGGPYEDSLYAQLGFHGTSATGAINVLLTGNLTATAGARNPNYAQIGHGGHDVDGSHSGAISINAAGDVTLVGGTFSNAYVQIGHGGRLSDGTKAGDITVDAGTVLVVGGTATNTYAQIGHGGIDSIGTFDGNINIDGAELDLHAGFGDEAYAQIGHGGAHSDGARSGRVHIDLAGHADLLGGDSNNAYAQVGHGGSGSDGDNSGRVTLLSDDTVDIHGGFGEHSYAQVGHGGRGSAGNNSSRIRVDAARSIRVDGGHELNAYAQIGHGGRNQTGDNSGRIEVESNRSVRVRGGDGKNTYAQIGHGGRGQEGDNSNRIDVTANRDVTVAAGDGNGASAQIGHGGRRTEGEQAGRVTIDAGRDVEVLGGHGKNAFAQIGHGGFRSLGLKRRDVSVTAGRDIFVYDGYDENAYAQIGHGGKESIGDATGDISVDAAALLDVEAGESENGYAQIGHGGAVANGVLSGDITIAAANLEVDFTTGGVIPSYAQIGHGGAFSVSEGSGGGDIDVTVTGDVTLAGGEVSVGYAQIGHGGALANGIYDGAVNLMAGGNLVMVRGTGEAAYAQVGHGGLFAGGSFTGDVTVSATDIDLTFAAIGGAFSGTFPGYVQIGHGGTTLSGLSPGGILISGDIAVTATGNLDLEGGDLIGSYAQIGHGGVSREDNLTGAIDVTVGGDLALTGGSELGAYTQIGHGGVVAAGDFDGAVNVDVVGDLSLTGGSAEGTSVQIGHGGLGVDVGGGSVLSTVGTRSGDVTITAGGLASFTEGTGGFWLGHQTATPDGLVNADLALSSGGLSVTGDGFEASLENALSGSIVTVVNTAAKGTANDGITLNQDINGPGRGNLILIANGDVTTQGLSGVDLVNLIAGGSVTMGQVSNVLTLQAGAAERILRNGDIGSAGSPLSNVVLVASEIPGGPFTIYADSATFSGKVGDRAAGDLASAVLVDVNSLLLSGPSALVGGYVGGLTAQPGADIAALDGPTGRVGTIGFPETSDYILIDPTTDLLYVIDGVPPSDGAGERAATLTTSEPQEAGIAGLGDPGVLVRLGATPLTTASISQVEGEGVYVPFGPGACGNVDRFVAALAGIFFTDLSGTCQ